MAFSLFKQCKSFEKVILYSDVIREFRQIYYINLIKIPFQFIPPPPSLERKKWLIERGERIEKRDIDIIAIRDLLISRLRFFTDSYSRRCFTRVKTRVFC